MKSSRIAILAALGLFVVSSASIAWIYWQARIAIVQIVRQEIGMTAKMAAHVVDGDLHHKIRAPEQVRSKEYEQAVSPLLKLHQANSNISYLYTMIYEGGKYYFILDTATYSAQLQTRHPLKPSEIMESYEDPSLEEADMRAALAKGQLYVNRHPYTDNYGTFMSGYAPFYNSQGKMEGFVGVDIDLNDFYAMIAALRSTTYRVLLVAALVAFLTGGAVWGLRRKAILSDRAKVRAEARKEKLNEAFQASQEQLKFALENTRDGVWDWDIPSGTLYVTLPWLEMLGYKEGELNLNIATWESLCHPDDLSKAKQLLQQHFEGKSSSYEFEHRLKHKSGKWIWVLGRGRIVKRDSNGQPLRMIGTNVDITRRKHADEELLSEKERLAVTLSSIADAVITVDKQQKITLLNAQAEKLTGWSTEEAIGKPVQEIFHLTDKITEEKIDLMGEFIKSGKTQGNIHTLENPVILSSKTGVQHTVVTSVTPMLCQQKAVIGMVLVFRDIAYELEVEQMKTHFVSSVSHELRTPLTSIKGFVSTLIQDPNMPYGTRMEFLRIIKNQSDRLNNLVDEILEISRIESERMTLHFETVDLVGMACKTLLEIEPLAQQEQILLNFQCNQHIPHIRGDNSKLQSVFNNLLNNAIKFTPSQGQIVLSIAKVDHEILIKVSDTGCGIPENELSKIFDKFYRVRRAGAEIPGTGLGLTIVQHIVNRHQGRIEVESQLNKGTTFKVYFPIPS